MVVTAPLRKRLKDLALVLLAKALPRVGYGKLDMIAVPVRLQPDPAAG
jgi:hypothetical protein